MDERRPIRKRWRWARRTVALGAVVNIALDPVLIYTLNMGIRGAAIATVFSQMLSAGAFLPENGPYFLARVAGVPFVEQIADRVQVVIPIGAVHVVRHGD